MCQGLQVPQPGFTKSFPQTKETNQSLRVSLQVSLPTAHEIHSSNTHQKINKLFNRVVRKRCFVRMYALADREHPGCFTREKLIDN